jgi:hypothetical protein
LNFILPHNITDKLYSLATRSSECGGLIFFELSKSTLRTLIAVEIIEINNISFNMWSEYLPDRNQIIELIIARSLKRKLFLPSLFHIHPVAMQHTNIQHDFYNQTGPSQEDIASSFYAYPYLEDGKLSLPEFVVCKHPNENWIFIGYYDSIRLGAVDVQRNFLQQELGLGLINEITPYLRSAKREIESMDFLTLVGYGIIGYTAYKAFQPQIQSFMNNANEFISAELALKLLETRIAAFGPVPYYSIARPGIGCTINLPQKGHQKKITKSTSKPRVTVKAFKEIKKLLGL